MHQPFSLFDACLAVTNRRSASANRHDALVFALDLSKLGDEPLHGRIIIGKYRQLEESEPARPGSPRSCSASRVQSSSARFESPIARYATAREFRSGLVVAGNPVGNRCEFSEAVATGVAPQAGEKTSPGNLQLDPIAQLHRADRAPPEPLWVCRCRKCRFLPGRQRPPVRATAPDDRVGPRRGFSPTRLGLVPAGCGRARPRLEGSRPRCSPDWPVRPARPIDRSRPIAASRQGLRASPSR